MLKLSKLFLAVAVVASVSTAHANEANGQAANRFSISTEVTKGGVVVSSGSQSIQNGGTAHFSDSQFKEIDAKVTVTCREGLKRWVNLFKPRCDEPVREVKQVPIGFKAEIRAQEVSDGRVMLNVAGNYVQVLSSQILPGAGADVRSASFRDSSLNSNAIIKPDTNLEITNGVGDQEIRLKVKVERL